MAQQAGRDCVIKKNSTAIAGARTVGITVNGSPISIEDQGDDGIATYLDGVLTGQSLELTIEGVEEDGILRGIATGAASGKFLTDLTFEYPDGDVISGDFVMTAYSETGAYEDAQMFNATFSSNGTWTVT